MTSFFTFPSKWIRKFFSLSQINIIFYFHYVLIKRERERERFSLILAEYSTCVFFTFSRYIWGKNE